MPNNQVTAGAVYDTPYGAADHGNNDLSVRLNIVSGSALAQTSKAVNAYGQLLAAGSQVHSIDKTPPAPYIGVMDGADTQVAEAFIFEQLSSNRYALLDVEYTSPLNPIADVAETASSIKDYALKVAPLLMGPYASSQP